MKKIKTLIIVFECEAHQNMLKIFWVFLDLRKALIINNQNK